MRLRHQPKGFSSGSGINQILFIDDFFRSEENGMAPVSRSNRKFLRGLFGAASKRLGWEVIEASPKSQGGQIDVAKVMAELGLSQDVSGWASACSANLSQLTERLGDVDISRSTLVVGWGIPPSVLSYIHSYGAIFIDVEIHPVRFGRDLLLAARTNDRRVQRILEDLRVNEEFFWAASAGLSGNFARRGERNILNSSTRVGLFFGQVDIDLALVGGGRIVKPSDFVTKLKAWAQEVDILAIKVHPAQQDAQSMELLLDSIPNALLVDCNSYALLSAENVVFVSSISSSVLTEARYFGCQDIRRLLIDDRNNPQMLPTYCSDWVPVQPDIASVATLQSISKLNRLPGFLRSTFPKKRRPATFADDTFTKIFGYRWGLDHKADGIPTFPVVSVCQSISFADQELGAACAIFCKGWHKPEHWGVWSASSHASLVMGIEMTEGRTLCIELHGHLFIPEPAAPPTVKIDVNGREFEEVDRAADGTVTWRVHLQAHEFSRSILLFSFVVSSAPRPCDVGASHHYAQPYGIGLKFIELSLPSE